MAGNKFDTQFGKFEAKDLTLTYKGLYGTPTTVKGTKEQLIRHLLEL